VDEAKRTIVPGFEKETRNKFKIQLKPTLPLYFYWFSFIQKAQQTIDLYTSTIFNSKPSATKEIELEKDGQFLDTKMVSRPSLKIYLPEQKSQQEPA